MNFDNKTDLLRHFLELHQDMLVSDDTNTGHILSLLDNDSLEKLQNTVLDALDLSTKSSKVKVERNKAGLLTQVIDLSQVSFGDEEALDLTKSKEALAIGEDNRLIISELNIPPADDRPKYSLNSLIEALKNTIEQDKKDRPVGQHEYDAGSEHSEEEEHYVDRFRDLSSDSDHTESGGEGEFELSVKTVVVDGKTMYKCNKCSKSFSKSCTFAKHAMIHAKLYPYRCGICNMKYRDMRVLLRHLDWHGENVDCPCKKCEKIEKEERKGLEGNKVCRFKCDICGKAFVSAEVCKVHVNMHSQENSLECEKCHMTFTCHRNLSRHRKSVHSLQFCPYCLESCTDLVAHFKKHDTAVLYRCGLCDEGFNSRPHLHEHLKVHTVLGKVAENTEPPTVPKRLTKGKVSKEIIEVKDVELAVEEKKLAAKAVTSAGEKKSTAAATIAKEEIKPKPPASAFVSQKLRDKIKIETFDKDRSGKIITKAVILNPDVSEPEHKMEVDKVVSDTPAVTSFVDINMHSVPDVQDVTEEITIPTTVLELPGVVTEKVVTEKIVPVSEMMELVSASQSLLREEENRVMDQNTAKSELLSSGEAQILEGLSVLSGIPYSDQEKVSKQDKNVEKLQINEKEVSTHEKSVEGSESKSGNEENKGGLDADGEKVTTKVDTPTTGMSLRRRTSRRCRWHDNDSVCERCDNTFIKKIAFGRKPKRGSRDSPRTSEEGSSLVFPLVESYYEGIEEDALSLPPAITTASNQAR